MNKTNAELMRELMDQLNEGYWGWDPPDFHDDDEESDAEAAEREHNERLDRRQDYGDNDDSDFDYDRDYKLNELPSYEAMCESGEFYFEERNVVSLEGAPDSVLEFVFVKNKVRSLQHCPQNIQYRFDCSDNGLKSLVGGPQGSIGNFTSKDNPLTDLTGCPDHIRNYFKIDTTTLKSYEGAPKNIEGWCIIPLITSDFRVIAAHFPQLGEHLVLDLASFGGRPRINQFENVLALFKTGVKKLGVEASPRGAKLYDEMVDCVNILNQFLPEGRKGMMKAQAALMKAGLGTWAKL